MPGLRLGEDMTGFRCDEYETALLGALKADSRLLDEIQLSADDFADSRRRAIFSAYQRIIESGRRPDDLTLTDEVRAQGVTPHDVSTIEPRSPGNAAYYAEQIRAAAQRRKLHALGIKLKESAEKAEPDELLAETEKVITTLSNGKTTEMQWLADVLYPTLAAIEARKGSLTGIPTGFSYLDRATNGFQAGDLIIIGARASIGKTAMALTIARAAAKARHKVGFFSCEMSRTQLTCRLLAAESNLNLLYVNSGFLGDEGYRRLNDAGTALYDAQILIDDTANPTLGHVRSGARRMKRMGVEIIFLDYLTLVQHGTPQMSRPERVGQISKSLKQLARELEVPVVAMSQLNREAEGKTPNLAELRQSGEIEEDSDMVLLLHRARVEVTDRYQTAHVAIAKHRNGPLGGFECVFMPESTRFAEKAHE
jgi:replicative DNA helicase